MDSKLGENRNLMLTKQSSYVTVNSTQSTESTLSDIDVQESRDNTLHADGVNETYDHSGSGCVCGMSHRYDNMKETHFCIELESLPPRTRTDNGGDQPHNGHDWHCHAREKTKADTVARNQLVAVSVLCFIFMIGEAIGKIIKQFY